jgi:hypothetical protein
LLAHGRWFSPGTPASFTIKTGCYEIAESGVKHQKSNQVKSIHQTVVLVDLWFSPGTPVSSINKTDCHDITEILLKVALNTIILTLTKNPLESQVIQG